MKIIKRLITFLIQYLTSVVQKIKAVNHESFRGILMTVLFAVPAFVMILSAIACFSDLVSFAIDGGYTTALANIEEYGVINQSMFSRYPLPGNIATKLIAILAVAYLIDAIIALRNNEKNLGIITLLKITVGIFVACFILLYLRGHDVLHYYDQENLDNLFLYIMFISALISVILLAILAGRITVDYILFSLTVFVIIPVIFWCLENILNFASLALSLGILYLIGRALFRPKSTSYSRSKRNEEKERRRELRMLENERAERQELEALIDDVLADEDFDDF